MRILIGYVVNTNKKIFRLINLLDMKSTTRFLLSTTLTLFMSLLFSFSGYAQDTYYHLIAGSFDELTPANELAESFESRSYNPAVLLPRKPGGRYRVSVYRTTSRAEIDAYAKSLGTAGESYWVLALKGQEVARTNARMTQPGKVVDPDENSYHLIVGSLDDFASAEEKVLELEKEGFEPYIIHPDGSSSRYRVSVFMSQDREEINTYQAFLRKRKSYGGWIYEAKPGEPANLAGSDRNFENSPGARLVGQNQRGESTTTETGNVVHYLIAGSFENFDQASRLSDALRLKGYSPMVMFPDPGVSDYFRVSVYQSTRRNRVEEFQKKYKQQTNNNNAWIFTQR